MGGWSRLAGRALRARRGARPLETSACPAHTNPAGVTRTPAGPLRGGRSVGDHRLEHVDLGGRPGRADGGDARRPPRPARRTWRPGGPGIEIALMPSSFSACDSASPMPIPRAAPLRAPISEITTDSQRTIARTWPRVMPTARSRPSSRVRSNTDSARVLTMPSRAITTASSSITVTKVSSWSMNPLASFSKLLLVEHLGVRVVGQGRRDRAPAPSPLSAPAASVTSAGGDELRAGEGVLLGEADDEVVADPALAVVDARPRAAGACRSRRTRP